MALPESTRHELTQGVWTEITTTDKNGNIAHMSGLGDVIYGQFESQPPAYDPETSPWSWKTNTGDTQIYFDLPATCTVWALALTDNCVVSTAPTEA